MAHLVARRSSSSVYIGRGSIWGNPYKVGARRTRKVAVKLYRRHLYAQLRSGEISLKQLADLHGQELFCAGCRGTAPCHGQVLVRAAAFAVAQLSAAQRLRRQLAAEAVQAEGYDPSDLDAESPYAAAGFRVQPGRRTTTEAESRKFRAHHAARGAASRMDRTAYQLPPVPKASKPAPIDQDDDEFEGCYHGDGLESSCTCLYCAPEVNMGLDRTEDRSDRTGPLGLEP